MAAPSQETEKIVVRKEDFFIFNGEYDYYGRVCENYGTRCGECKWQNEYRCRDGKFRG